MHPAPGSDRRWLDRALAQASTPTPLRARALLVNGYLASVQGDSAAGLRVLNEGEELARHLNAEAALAHAAFIRGLGALYANDLPVAVEILDRVWTTLSGAPDLELDLYLNVLLSLCVAAGLVGDHERAIAYQQELLAITESRGGLLHRLYALHVGGLIAWRRRDLRRAAAQEMASLRLNRGKGPDDRYVTALCLEVLAWITADQQQHRRAATLLGAAETLRTDVGTPITSYRHLVGFHDECERQVRGALGAPAFTDAFQHGQTLTYDDASAYALDEPRQPGPTPHRDTSTLLTRRERQVADLIAHGLSNKDIAATLVISQRTAESHVEHILTKLGATSRAQVAAWKAVQQSRDQNS